MHFKDVCDFLYKPTNNVGNVVNLVRSDNMENEKQTTKICSFEEKPISLKRRHVFVEYFKTTTLRHSHFYVTENSLVRLVKIYFIGNGILYFDH